MTSKFEPRVPDGLDVTTPSIARIYDYLLFGKDNFAVDRAAAEHLLQSPVQLRRYALANRAFLVRAVGFLAEQGVDQFIDLGSGLPTKPNVHEVARSVKPNARVVYVDHDPIVVSHNNALLATSGVVTVREDIRDPDAILRNAALNECIDFDRPVAVLLLSILHFISDEEDPAGIVAKFRKRLVPGSYLAITHGTSDGADPLLIADTASTYRPARVPFNLRSRDQIMALFDGFTLVEPGLVSPPDWRPEPTTDRTPLKATSFAAVGELAGRSAVGSA
jgi:hypothetical protein